MTRLLALETTERPGSVAAAENGLLLQQIDLPGALRTTEGIAPAVDQLLRKVGWHPRDVQLVACCVGPGSFTGLRVGVTMAKTFAYCIGADVLGLDTLEVIAARVPTEVTEFWVVMDAQRQQVVAAPFCRGSARWPQPDKPAMLLPIDTWLAQLPPGTVVTGPALRKLAGRLPSGVDTTAPEHWPPTAAAVAQVAHHHFAAGRRDQLWTLRPHYIRPSYAEEKFPKGGPWPQPKRSL